MKTNDIHEAIKVLRQEVPKWKTPIVTIVAGDTGNPFKVLISCLLSLRTKDETTAVAYTKLCERAMTPEEILQIPVDELAKIIYPVGFYKNKAQTLHDVCHAILEKYDGKVPDELDELLTLKGVGRKTANLVITLGFGKYGICVDTHVHRITNRWGYVKTTTPEETEFVLRKKLPKEYWIEINDHLVTYGQNLCVPISPKCSECKITHLCSKVDVKKSR